VLERAQSLRYAGQIDYDKRPHEVIDYVTNDGARLTLYIDQQTGLLSKFETLITDPFAGDAVFETRFTGQHKVGKYIVPARRVNVLNGDHAGGRHANYNRRVSQGSRGDEGEGELRPSRHSTERGSAGSTTTNAPED
jgi:hypothetical protein